MSNGFPCPNPACAQVFAADAVKGASRLVCPRCGTTFQFRPAPSARPKAPAKAPKPPPVPPPLPAKAPPPLPPANIPVAQPVETAPSALSFNSEPDVLVAPRHRKARSRRRYGTWIVFLVLMLFCVGAFAAGGYGLYYFFGQETEQGKQARHGNFHFKQ